MDDLAVIEEMILLAVWKLKDNAYGVTIRRHISRVTGRTFPYGTLYSSLAKLVRQRFLSKSCGAPSPERGGRGKNFYNITPQGIKALKNALELKNILWDKATEYAFSKH